MTLTWTPDAAFPEIPSGLGRRFAKWIRSFLPTGDYPMTEKPNFPLRPAKLPTEPSMKNLLEGLNEEIHASVSEQYAQPKHRRAAVSDDYVTHFRQLAGEQPLDVMALLIANLTYKDMKRLSDEVSPLFEGTSGPQIMEALHRWSESRVAILQGPLK